MAFSVRQLRALRQKVRPEHVRTREMRGRELHYIEGWHAIAEANRIFGFDAWDRETVETKCVNAREMRGQFTAIYIAKVRVTVRADGQVILREGQGTGEAQGATLGEAHDKALKTAETDATKRALATFGHPFGLGLYLGAVIGRSRGPQVFDVKPGEGFDRTVKPSRTVPVEQGSAYPSANGSATSATVPMS